MSWPFVTGLGLVFFEAQNQKKRKETFDSWVLVALSPAFLLGSLFLKLRVLNCELFLSSPQNSEGGTFRPLVCNGLIPTPRSPRTEGLLS